MGTASENAREERKANALVAAWRARYKSTPTINAVVLVLSVAELETNAGDFRDSHNWGQIMRRVLTPVERAKLADGMHLLPTDEKEILSTDTLPNADGSITTYPIWLWKFPDDVAGADKLLAVLLDSRPGIKRAIDTMSFEDLASEMYDSNYYEGSKPKTAPGGPAANKAAYAASLRKQNVGERLLDWTMPPAIALVPPPVVITEAPEPAPDSQAATLPEVPSVPVATPAPLAPSNAHRWWLVLVGVLSALAAALHWCHP